MAMPPEAIPPGALSSSYNGHPAVVFTAIFLVLQIFIVSLRYITKWMVNVKWGYDDVLVLISLAMQIGIAGITFDALLSRSVGYHQIYIEFNTPQKVPHWFKELYALIFIYDFSAILPKLAILIFYNRVFGSKIYARWQIWALQAILILYIIILTILEFVTCRPIAANWDPEIPGAKCLNKGIVATWVILPNILTDIWMLVLPIPVLWCLQTTKRLKIGLTINFLFGSLGLLSSVARFVISKTTPLSDESWQAAKLLIFLQLEPGCYLICACLPMLRPLLDRVVGYFVDKLPPGTIRSKLSSRSRTGATSNNEEFNMQASWKPPPPSAGQFRRLDDETDVIGNAKKPRNKDTALEEGSYYEMG